MAAESDGRLVYFLPLRPGEGAYDANLMPINDYVRRDDAHRMIDIEANSSCVTCTKMR